MEKIEDCDGDPNLLFKVIDKISQNNDEPQLPSHNSLDELVNKFADYFTEKILSSTASVVKSVLFSRIDESIFTDTKSLLPTSEDNVCMLIQ